MSDSVTLSPNTEDRDPNAVQQTMALEGVPKDATKESGQQLSAMPSHALAVKSPLQCLLNVL